MTEIRDPRISAAGETAVPEIVDRATWQTARDALLAREKAHTHEADAIAAARRRLPMVEVDPAVLVVGPDGPVPLREAFEGRTQLIAYYFMWHSGQPAPDVCEGCTYYTAQVQELSYLHSRDVTYAVFCRGPYAESVRYRDFMGWEVPWYSVGESGGKLLAGRSPGMMHLVCYLRRDDRVFETYENTLRGVQAMDYTYALLDLTVYGRQEPWEDSPPGWPQRFDMTGGGQVRRDGRPIAQWSRLAAGRSDDLAAGTGPARPV